MPSKYARFGEFMRTLRIEAHLSVEDAARLIGVGVALLKEWEAGVSLPSDLSGQRISQVYNIPEAEWLRVLGDALKRV